MRTLLAEVAKHAGEEVEVRGWVHHVRELGKISFLLLRDRSGTAQCVVEGKAEVTPESVVIVRGKVAANDKAPGGYEVQVSSLQVVARAEPDLPVPVNQDPEKLSLEGERILCEWAAKEHGVEAIFVHGFPARSAPSTPTRWTAGSPWVSIACSAGWRSPPAAGA